MITKSAYTNLSLDIKRTYGFVFYELLSGKDFKESDLYPILNDHTLKNSFNCTEKGTLINLVSCHKSIKIKYFYINGKYPIEILPDDDLVQYFGFKKKLGIGKKNYFIF